MAVAGSNSLRVAAIAALNSASSFKNRFSEQRFSKDIWQCKPLPDKFFFGFAANETDKPFACVYAVRLCFKIRIESAKWHRSELGDNTISIWPMPVSDNTDSI